MLAGNGRVGRVDESHVCPNTGEVECCAGSSSCVPNGSNNTTAEQISQAVGNIDVSGLGPAARVAECYFVDSTRLNELRAERHGDRAADAGRVECTIRCAQGICGHRACRIGAEAGACSCCFNTGCPGDCGCRYCSCEEKACCQTQRFPQSHSFLHKKRHKLKRPPNKASSRVLYLRRSERVKLNPDFGRTVAQMAPQLRRNSFRVFIKYVSTNFAVELYLQIIVTICLIFDSETGDDLL